MQDTGGAEKTAYQILNGFCTRNHEVTLFTTTVVKNPKTHKVGCINVHPYHRDIRIKSSRYSLDLMLKPISYDFDLIQSHFTVPSAVFAGYYYSIKKKKPLVIIHHSDLNPSEIINPLYKVGAFFSNFLYLKPLSHAEVIVCPSKNFAEHSPYLRKFLQKIIIIPNGIDTKRFSDIPQKEHCRQIIGFNNKNKIILFVGALEYVKGPQILIKVLPSLIKKFPDIRVIIIGAGSLLNELTDTVKLKHLEKYVHFTGILPQTQLKFYYAASDICVIPSYSESFCNVILESMICGVPIIASNVGGIIDIVKDGENGVLFQPGNEMQFRNQICELLEDESKRKELILRGLEFVKQYSWEKTVLRYEKLYNNIVGGY